MFVLGGSATYQVLGQLSLNLKLIDFVTKKTGVLNIFKLEEMNSLTTSIVRIISKISQWARRIGVLLFFYLKTEAEFCFRNMSYLDNVHSTRNQFDRLWRTIVRNLQTPSYFLIKTQPLIEWPKVNVHIPSVMSACVRVCVWENALFLPVYGE
jgi:hypothetical protein